MLNAPEFGRYDEASSPLFEAEIAHVRELFLSTYSGIHRGVSSWRLALSSV